MNVMELCESAIDIFYFLQSSLMKSKKYRQHQVHVSVEFWEQSNLKLYNYQQGVQPFSRTFQILCNIFLLREQSEKIKRFDSARSFCKHSPSYANCFNLHFSELAPGPSKSASLLLLFSLIMYCWLSWKPLIVRKVLHADMGNCKLWHFLVQMVQIWRFFRTVQNPSDNELEIKPLSKDQSNFSLIGFPVNVNSTQLFVRANFHRITQTMTG